MSQERLECAYHLCSRKPLESSKDEYCIFHARTEEKDARGFDTALKSYISEITEKHLDYNFRGFVFVDDFISQEYFPASKFFPEYVGVKMANFRKAEFHKDAIFEETIFEGRTSFLETKFHGEADFEEALFQGEINFRKANFRQEAYFLRAQFEETANFKETKFHGEAAFSGAEFWAYTTFLGAEVEKSLDFNGVEFHKRASISPKFIKGKVLFVAAVLDNISLISLNLDKDALIDFTDARLRNTEMKREEIESHIIQKHEGNFLKAKEIYLLLKNNFHSLGRYDEESWAFKKEKDMERKSYSQGRPLKWLGSMFWNLLYGYGERPFWILGWCGFLLLLSSCIYWLSKGVFQVIGIHLIPVEDYWNNLYFSVVTFTTLGYGDFRPIGKIRVLASLEAFLGIFFIALFIKNTAEYLALQGGDECRVQRSWTRILECHILTAWALKEQGMQYMI